LRFSYRSFLVSGYKFRFRGDTEDRAEFKLKRGYGYVIEPVTAANTKDLSVVNSSSAVAAPTRNTRASRGEYSIGNQQNIERSSSTREGFKALAAVKVSLFSNLFH
jgi:hypothetical protein